MTLSASTLTNDIAAITATPTTASITPTAGQLITAWVFNDAGSGIAANTPAITAANGISWLLEGTVPFGASNRFRWSVFTARPLSPTAGSVSITFDGQVQERIGWAIHQVPSSTTHAKVENVTTDDFKSVNPALTSPGDADAVAGMAGFAVSSAMSSTPASGWTELLDFPVNVRQMATHFRATPGTASGATYASIGTNSTAGIALELSEATAAVETIIINVHNGTTWVPADVYVHDGSQWVNVTTAATVADPGVLWASDFSGDGFASLGDGETATVWDSKANGSFGTYQGKAAWNIVAPVDTRNGTKVRALFTDLGVTPATVARLRYSVFIEEAADLALDLKLPGFASLPSGQSLWDASSGGTKSDDSASVRLHLRPAGGFSSTRPYIDAYVYAHSGGGQTFTDWGLYWRLSESMNATGTWDGDELPIPVGQWFDLVIEAGMNTVGNADGTLKVWLDGVQGIDLTDMDWVHAAPYEWNLTMFETFYNEGSHSGATIHLADMQFTDPGA